MSSAWRAVLWTALILAAAASLLVTLEIANQTLVVGSGEGGWVYQYLQPLRSMTLAIAALAIVAGCAALILGGAVRGGRVWHLLLLWFLVGLVIEALLRSLTPFTLEQMFVSEGANSFYSVTRHYYASSVLRDFHTLRESWPPHAQSNMPGKMMLLYALKPISREPYLLAWLTIVVSNLGALLMYRFARDLFDDARIGLWSAVLYLVVPGKMFFFPLMNTVTPVAVLVCACLLLRWVKTERTIFAALLGIALYGLVFFEPLPLVMGLLFVALVLSALARGTLSSKHCLLQGLVGFAAFWLTYFVVRWLTGFDLVLAFRQLSEDAAAFNVATGRPYDLWVRQNLWDFALGVGICQALLVVVALGDGLIQSVRTRLLTPAALLTISLLAVLAATDLIGVNRGEVVRLWIFLACFLQIPAAYVCARLESRTAVAIVLAVTVLQAALGTAMIGFVLPG